MDSVGSIVFSVVDGKIVRGVVEALHSGGWRSVRLDDGSIAKAQSARWRPDELSAVAVAISYALRQRHRGAYIDHARQIAHLVGMYDRIEENEIRQVSNQPLTSPQS